MVVVARWQWMGGRAGGRLSASGWAHPEGEDGMPEDLQLERLDLLLRHALQRSYGLVTRLTGPGEATIELSEGSSHIQRAEVARRRLGAVMLPPLLVVAW